jgi:eukaryotic-like serine/threonine-protein kinase
VLGSLASEGYYIDFRLSPDETQLAASLVDPKAGTPNVWLTDIARGSTQRFAPGTSFTASPVWSPDAARIVFRAVAAGVSEFYQKSASGGGKEDPVLLAGGATRSIPPGSNSSEPTDWSPDGRYIVFSTFTSSHQLWLMPVAGDGKPVKFLDSRADQMHGNLSPDGQLIAYSSNESGRFEVHVQTFPPSDHAWQVSTDGGSEPGWRRDGHEIYYLSEDRKLMAVSIGGGTTFGVPKPLFQTRVPAGVSSLRQNYVPSIDGRRFLVNTPTGDPPSNPITIVMNWTSALQK